MRINVFSPATNVLVKCLDTFFKDTVRPVTRGHLKKCPYMTGVPRHRYISMLNYILVHRKCNLDIPILTFKCPLITGFTVFTRLDRSPDLNLRISLNKDILMLVKWLPGLFTIRSLYKASFRF